MSDFTTKPAEPRHESSDAVRATPRTSSATAPPQSGSDWPAGTLFGAVVPMANSLGFVPIAIGADGASIRMPYDERYANNRGDMHGGSLMTLLDCTLACAARSHDPVDCVVMTIDLTTHFIAGAGSDVTGTARCLKRGRSMAFCQGELRDAAGTLVATGTATFKLLHVSHARGAQTK